MQSDETVTPGDDDEIAAAMISPSRDSGPWIRLIERAESRMSYWQDRCDNIEKQYANLKRLAENRLDREYQMFYANMEVVRPSIYARSPAPVVSTRFNERKPLWRKTAELLERVTTANFDRERGHDALKLARNDLALFGRGAAWMVLDEYDGTEGVRECVKWLWVHRKDFLHAPARCWSEVPWVARRAWMTDANGRARFGQAWKNISLTSPYEDGRDEEDDTVGREREAAVWEIWHKTARVVVWVHPGSDEILDMRQPLVDLDGFFPCPCPAYGTVEPGTLVPVPDFLLYRDQLEEVNELTARISALSEALRMKGFYFQGAEDVGQAIERAIADMDNRALLIGVPSFSMGGDMSMSIRDAVTWLPVQEVASTVSSLVALRRQIIDDIYQISGISDIMRGQTVASETLGAQQLKSQYGSIRIRERQEEMARLASDGLAITGEMIAENFSPETLLEMSCMQDMPSEQDLATRATQAIQQARQQAIQQANGDPQALMQIDQSLEQTAGEVSERLAQAVTIEKIVDLLRRQRLRPFVLQVSTDSTMQPDENAEKAARSEFMSAFSAGMQQVQAMIAMAPETASFAGQMLKFALAPFRAGREMDGAVDDLVETLKEKATKASEPSQAPPSPDMIRAKAAEDEAARQERRAMMDEQVRQAEAARKMELAQFERDVRMHEAMRKAEEDAARMAHEQVMAQISEQVARINLQIAMTKAGQFAGPVTVMPEMQ